MKKTICILLIGALFWFNPCSAAKEAYGAQGTYSSNDTYVLAKMIHGEARGEPYIGMVAVGAVILNRVKDKKFPDSVYGVCFQPGAFDAVKDGQYYLEPSQSANQSCESSAKRLGSDVWGALLLESQDGDASKWIWSRNVIVDGNRSACIRSVRNGRNSKLPTDCFSA